MRPHRRPRPAARAAHPRAPGPRLALAAALLALLALLAGSAAAHLGEEEPGLRTAEGGPRGP